MKYILALLPPLLLAACGSAPQPLPDSEANLPPAHVDPATAGTISGRVLFSGDAPAMPVIDMSSNPNCEREHRTPQRAETVIVNPNGTLRYVFVWIKEGLPKARWTAPSTPATLDQTGCMYEPHVQGIMTGQPLAILNHDPVNHNVHAECQVNRAWNESQPPRAGHMIKTFPREEILFPVTCSVHPWMRAYIGVSPHPYYAVTGPDGAFTLRDVPPGAYTLEAIHEKYGRKEAKITLVPGASATMDFRYGS